MVYKDFIGKHLNNFVLPMLYSNIIDIFYELFWFDDIAVFLLKLLYSTGTVDEFLFSGKERMALRTDLDSDLAFGGSGFKGISACTCDLALIIVRMYIFLHLYLLNRDTL